MKNPIKNKGGAVDLQRRWLLHCGLLAMLPLGLPLAPAAASKTAAEKRVTSLEALIDYPPLEGPRMVLKEFALEGDDEIKARILSDLVQRPELLARIRTKVPFGRQLTLSIDKLTIRLLYIPETREVFRHLYGDYCRRAIALLLEKMGGQDIYRTLTWPRTERPEIPGGEGITAFLVHRLAKEYVAECTFGAPTGETARYRLKGSFESDHLGAVDLMIESPRTGEFTLQRKNVSIWQNRTDNLYTLMAIPLEETLHYLIGEETDRIILAELKTNSYRRVDEVRKLANDWLAIEEALVGGLVRPLVRDYTQRHGIDLDATLMERSLADKEGLSQYRHREAGIRLVDHLGYLESVKMYRRDPLEFQRRLELV